MVDVPEWELTGLKSIQLLTEIGRRVQKAVKPLMGKPNAGDWIRFDKTTSKMRLDAVAADAVRRYLDQNLSCYLVSEELGSRKFGRDPRLYVVLDEVDGTYNGSKDIPIMCTSVAASLTPNLDGVFAGVIIDLYSGNVYAAYEGGGSFKDGVRIRTANSESLQEAVFSIKTTPMPKAWLGAVTPLLEKAGHGRDLGAAAMELSFLARGSLDAVVDLRGSLRVTDVAAGLLLVREAGGVVRIIGDQPSSIPLRPERRVSFVAASTPQFMQKLVSTMGLSNSHKRKPTTITDKQKLGTRVTRLNQQDCFDAAAASCGCFPHSLKPT